MEMSRVNDLRQGNKLPFQVVGWLEVLTAVIEHDEFGMMYRGRVIAEDEHGRYLAIIGTTDQLLSRPLNCTSNNNPYKILKVEKCGLADCC